MNETLDRDHPVIGGRFLEEMHFFNSGVIACSADCAPMYEPKMLSTFETPVDTSSRAEKLNETSCVKPYSDLSQTVPSETADVFTELKVGD
jgi:2-keto-4-pentenoate hydratase